MQAQNKQADEAGDVSAHIPVPTQYEGPEVMLSDSYKEQTREALAKLREQCGHDWADFVTDYCDVLLFEDYQCEAYITKMRDLSAAFYKIFPKRRSFSDRVPNYKVLWRMHDSGFWVVRSGGFIHGLMLRSDVEYTARKTKKERDKEKHDEDIHKKLCQFLEQRITFNPAARIRCKQMWLGILAHTDQHYDFFCRKSATMKKIGEYIRAVYEGCGEPAPTNQRGFLNGVEWKKSDVYYGYDGMGYEGAEADFWIEDYWDNQ